MKVMALKLSVVSEGVEAAAAVYGAADDDVIKEFEFHFAGRFREAFCEIKVSPARRGAAGRMVVGEDKVAGLIDEDRAKDFADGSEGLVGSPAGDFMLTDEAGGGIEAQNDQLLCCLQGQLR